MIFLDDSFIKIDGILLPGLVKSMEVNTDAAVDEQEVEGSTKKPKQATGYEDAKITIEISLMDGAEQTKEDKLRVIQNLFRRNGQEKPLVHSLITEHTSIRGIQQVIIKNMSSKETNKKEEITVSLELWEYVVMTVQAKKKGSQSKGKKTETASVSTLTREYENYMAADRGNAPQRAKKTLSSPAIDNASAYYSWT